MATVSDVWPSGMSSSSIMVEFPALFSPTLGTANCTPYEVELTPLLCVRRPTGAPRPSFKSLGR
jgi:hypothetical protein